MNQFETEKQELKEKTRTNIKFDKAWLALYAITFCGTIIGGVIGTVQKIAEDPKDIESYLWLPSLLTAYYMLVLGNRVIGDIKPKFPIEHMEKYKQELRKLYQQYQTVQQTPKQKIK